MQYPRFCLLIAFLLSSCSQSGADIDYAPVRAGNPELQKIMIDEFEGRGIDYRITEKGTLEADFARRDDIVEIGQRIADAYLPKERSFSINPDVLNSFRAQLDEEKISYRIVHVDGLEWTIVEKQDVSRAREIKDLVFEAYLKKQFPNNASPPPEGSR